MRPKLKIRSHKCYGWLPDLPDFRDQKLKLPRAVNMPPVVNLQPQCPPVVDQLTLGSCTANAIAGAVLFGMLKQGLKDAAAVSRLFIYYQERVIEGTVREDSGAMLRDGIKAVAVRGAPPETDWPYIISRFAKKPSAIAYKDALLHQAIQYSAVPRDLTAMKQTLASGLPFVIGFSVYSSFEGNTVARTGVAPMPGRNDNLLGGHAVLCIGYDDNAQTWRLRNSWGTKWGQQGYFTLPRAYLLDENLSDDFWAIQQMEG